MRLLNLIAVILLFLLLFNLGKFLLWIVQFLLMLLFLLMAYDSYKEQKTLGAIVYLILALLFQPFFSFGLKGLFWTIVKIALILWFVLLLIGVKGEKSGV